MDKFENNPLVTVCIPAHLPLAQTTLLIRSLVAQTHDSFQLIVLYDQNIPVLDTHILPTSDRKLISVQFEKISNPHPVAQLFTAVGKSTGRYFMFLEEVLPQDGFYVEKHTDCLEGNKEAVLCCPKNTDRANQADTVGRNASERILKLAHKHEWNELRGIIRLSALQNMVPNIHSGEFGAVLLLLCDLCSYGNFISVESGTWKSHDSAFTFKINSSTGNQDKIYSSLVQRVFAAILKNVTHVSETYAAKVLFLDALLRNQVWTDAILKEHNLLDDHQVRGTYIGFFAEKFLGQVANDLPEVSPASDYSSLAIETKASVEKANAFVLDGLRNRPVDIKTKTAIVIASFRPAPPRDGAENRCHQMILALQKAGFKVVYFCALSHQWSFAHLEYLDKVLNISTILDVGNRHIDRTYYKLYPVDVYSWQSSSPGLEKCFYEAYRQIKPDLIWMNYAFWGKLATNNSFQSSLRIIDAIDLLSLNKKMAKLAWDYLNANNASPPYGFDNLTPAFLSEDFYVNAGLKPDKAECELYDSFDYCVAISQREANVIAECTSRTRTTYLPFAFEYKSLSNTYAQAPIFAIGPNQFNYQGYFYFTQKVLPIIRQTRKDFELAVTGTGCASLEPTVGVKLMGFVPDIELLYMHSKFAICPLIGATGQQLKVMEAMAHGLPVVALANVAERCPIYHNINGFVAHDAESFAAYTLQLYENPELCRKMGQAARQTIAEEHNLRKLQQQLAEIVKDAKYDGSKASHIAPVIKFMPLYAKIYLLYWLRLLKKFFSKKR